jgi:hypothetical protein
VTGCRIMVRHLVELIGTIKLVELKERDVDFALGTLAERLSTRSVRLARMILIQARRQASHAYRCYHARSAVREQRKDQRGLKLNR